MNDVNRVQRALAAIAEAAGRSKWVVGGSAGLLLRGLPLSPNDVDIYCDDEDVASLHHALREYAVDQPEHSTTAIYRSRLAHYRIDGVFIELVGGFRVSALGCTYSIKVKELLIPYAHLVQLPEATEYVHVVPLAHELLFNVLRERQDRVTPIAAMMERDLKRHLPALEALEKDNAIPDAMRIHIREMMFGMKAEVPLWKQK
ncbi:hypothetical protein [Paenibacillus sp. J5C2022]|uniref:hypothetical protein n=1 Tax=Paenibacillus sp. J5C2022 TaxID=2977129 RepID=UPI0021D01253|nr:hypothetical protein [Paenibacillus sp. J5C2022]